MIPLGLSVPDQRAFEAGLVASHSVRITVRVLDLDHNIVREVRGRVLSGQVDVDSEADVQRTASLSIYDPDYALNLDSANAVAGGLFLDRMVQVLYGVWSQQLPRWVDVPVFTGPITGMSRDDDVVSLSAAGKESLLLTESGVTKTWPAGVYKTDLVKAVLQAGGEMAHDVPHWTTKTTKAISLGPSSRLWEVAKSVARSWGEGLLTYDGTGTAKLFTASPAIRWTFRAGDGGSLVGVPKLAYDASSIRNFVQVTGATPAGKKDPVVATAIAPKASPLSPANLGRGGVPRYLRETIADDTITSKAAAQKIADAQLAARMTEGVQLDFTALVIPHLEPLDKVTVQFEKWATTMQLTKYTIPLTGSDTMSVGRNFAAKSVRRNRPTARKGPRSLRPNPIAVTRAKAAAPKPSKKR